MFCGATGWIAGRGGAARGALETDGCIWERLVVCSDLSGSSNGKKTIGRKRVGAVNEKDGENQGQSPK